MFGNNIKVLILISFFFLFSVLAAFFLSSIPSSYEQCMKVYGKNNDYDHNHWKCNWRTRRSEVIKYYSCLIHGGHKSGGLIGCSFSSGCTKSAGTCELVYYEKDFFLPSSYNECLNYSESFDAKYPRITKKCMLMIDSWGYDNKKAKSLYNTCLSHSGNTSDDSVWSERTAKSCLLQFTKD